MKQRENSSEFLEDRSNVQSIVYLLPIGQIGSDNYNAQNKLFGLTDIGENIPVVSRIVTSRQDYMSTYQLKQKMKNLTDIDQIISTYHSVCQNDRSFWLDNIKKIMSYELKNQRLQKGKKKPVLSIYDETLIRKKDQQINLIRQQRYSFNTSRRQSQNQKMSPSLMEHHLPKLTSRSVQKSGEQNILQAQAQLGQISKFF